MDQSELKAIQTSVLHTRRARTASCPESGAKRQKTKKKGNMQEYNERTSSKLVGFFPGVEPTRNRNDAKVSSLNREQCWSHDIEKVYNPIISESNYKEHAVCATPRELLRHSCVKLMRFRRS